jgi:hypothetical protein
MGILYNVMRLTVKIWPSIFEANTNSANHVWRISIKCPSPYDVNGSEKKQAFEARW